MITLIRKDKYFYIAINNMPGDNREEINNILTEEAKMYTWRRTLSVEWYAGNAIVSPYYYIQQGNLEIPLLENYKYTFRTRSGDLLSQVPIEGEIYEVFDHTSHKRLWQWLAQNPGKTKDEALSALGMSIPEECNSCFACLYAMRRSRTLNTKFFFCALCPLLVKDCDISQVPAVVKNHCTCSEDCLGGLYAAWEASTDDNVARTVALIIANLSINADVPTK